MVAKDRKPVIGITSDSILIRDVIPASAVYKYYTHAVTKGAGGLPWVIPPLAEDLDMDTLIAHLDGIVFTGSRTNVQPHHYDGGPAPENNPEDPDRDGTTLPLIRKVIEAGLPMLCICRGLQELNVALGGTLHQEVHKVEGRDDHRAPDPAPPEEKFALAHEISIEPDTMLSRIAGATRQTVNSVHGQGIDRVSGKLKVEAEADDGTVEAVTVKDAKAFSLGVQWHPEWEFEKYPLYTSIWKAFGDACREHAAGKK